MNSFRLSSLSIVNYRSYESLLLNFEKRVNLIVGRNGIGKTNVLDAIYLLSFSKGFLASSEQQNIRKGAEEFLVKGSFDVKGKETEVFCGFKKGKKKAFKRNGKEYEKIRDHIGMFPAILVSPQDSELISGGAEMRRKFMDGHLSQVSNSYLDVLTRYSKGMIQRNAALKSRSGGLELMLEAMDYKLAPLGEEIRKQRQRFFEDLQAPFEKYYALLSDEREEVCLSYKEPECSVADGWLENRQKDLALGYTSTGPHRDELRFKMDGHAIRRFGSQGQQKSFLLALKLAQAELLEATLKISPILLLDDVFDKLDNQRVALLVEKVVQPYKGQVFITNTQEGEMMQQMEKAEVQLWNLDEEGILSE